LPDQMRKEYLPGKREKSLMDYKSDILAKVPTHLIGIGANLPVTSENVEESPTR
jgi:hypothetical protein